MELDVAANILFPKTVAVRTKQAAVARTQVQKPTAAKRVQRAVRKALIVVPRWPKEAQRVAVAARCATVTRTRRAKLN
jgi:hypothetical protein